MTMYGLPDITGQNTSYLRENVPFFVYQPGIQIEFENSPIFESSLVMSMIDGSAFLLTNGVDYQVQPSDIDQTAMSRAFLSDPTFTGVLIKSITMLSTRAVGKAVVMTYQEFYLTQPGRTFDDGTPFEVTPDLIKSLVSGQASLFQQVANVSSPIVSNLVAPTLLPFDINAQLSNNVVTNESAIVNTIAGAKVIRLSQGPFFANSVTITHNGSPLDPASDYLPIVLSPLTAQSTDRGGIYQYLLINAQISGPVLVTYHALGGDVQQNDLESVYGLSVAIKDYLSQGSFLTPDSIAQTPAFLAFNSRLSTMETEMRRLQTGAPTYGDATSGMVAVRPIAAVDSNFHWYTIAKLYQVVGSTDIVTADSFRGRVHLPGAKIALTFTCDVNFNLTRNQVSLNTESLVFDSLYELFQSLSVAAPCYPMIRVAWNKSGTTFSGAVIQFGIPLTALSDTMAVEDMSTTQSCWLLDQTGIAINGNAATVSSPRDSAFTLPDGVSVWSPGSSVSFSKTFVPTFKNGYLVYAGSNVTLEDVNTVLDTTSLFTSVLPYYFPVIAGTELIVTLMSSDGTKVYDVRIPLISSSANTTSGSVTFTASTGELVGATGTLTQNSGGNSTVGLNIADIGTSIWTNNGAEGYTDVIRYIRVKV